MPKVPKVLKVPRVLKVPKVMHPVSDVIRIPSLLAGEMSRRDRGVY